MREHTAATRMLMSVSALFLGLLGGIGTFAPDEVLRRMDAPESPFLLLVVQVAGALYLGFAMLDWMARDNLIGGVYSRPVAIGNLAHFVVAGLAVLRLLWRFPELRGLWPVALGYAVLAAAFAGVLWRHPVRASARG